MLAMFTARLANGESLARAEMTEAIDAMMCGDALAADVRAFLLVLRAKGETAEEIAGAAEALRKHMTRIESQRDGVVDTCGTGGVGSNLFNISTTAAIVAAACGVPVAKHGNRGITSKSGSADVLAALGVNIEAPPAVVARCLDELGLCFCFAPKQHPAMRHVAAIRKELGVATIFNFLGPLCNPASAPFQLMGVGRSELRRTMAQVLLTLGSQRAVVVTGDDGLGEITLATTTRVTEVRDGVLHDYAWEPADFGLETASTQTMVVAGPEASAAQVRAVLAGERGPLVAGPLR
jgi:anthranilate phosphoribosyltransferase